MKKLTVILFLSFAAQISIQAQNYNNNNNVVNNNGQSSSQSTSSYTDANGRVHTRVTTVQNGMTYIYEDGRLVKQYQGNGSYSNNTGNQNQNNVNTQQQGGQQPCPGCYRMAIPNDPPASNNNNSSTSNSTSSYTDANGITHTRRVVEQNGVITVYVDGQQVQQYRSNGSYQNNTGNGNNTNNNSNRNNQQQRRQQPNGNYYH
jgi:hypothetical protein